MARHFDAVVVGGGSSGSVVAARLSEDPARSVLLVEAGPSSDPGLSRRWSDPDRLPASGESIVTAAVEERTGAALLRGRVLGGSSAVNGAYFVRPTAEDLADWSARGGPSWAPSMLGEALVRLESDAEFGGADGHGATGPVPVTRHGAPEHPVTRALFAAASAAGHPEQPDLNGGGRSGWGLVPRNVDRQGRVSAATAYLTTAVERPNLTLRTETVVRRVLFDGARAVGVELVGWDGEVEQVGAGLVVSSAGALGSPELLFRSGLGPAEQLRAAGVDPLVELPGLGAGAANHAAVDLFWTPLNEVADGPLVQGALYWDTAAGPAEVLGICRPYGRATGDAPDDRALPLRVSTMSAHPFRVEFAAGGAPGALRVEAGDPHAAAGALVEGVRHVAELAGRAPFAALVGEWQGPDDRDLRDDAALADWIRGRLVWSHHLCATAPMGASEDPATVVDPSGRVHGVDGLAVVDVSILPTVPRRGPACSAISIAELLAPGLAGEAAS